MQIEVKGRHVPITDELREQVERRFAKVAKQVNGSAVLQIELMQEKNPAISRCEIAEATIHLKGITLRAGESASGKMSHAINLSRRGHRAAGQARARQAPRTPCRRGNTPSRPPCDFKRPPRDQGGRFPSDTASAVGRIPTAGDDGRCAVRLIGASPIWRQTDEDAHPGGGRDDDDGVRGACRSGARRAATQRQPRRRAGGRRPRRHAGHQRGRLHGTG